MLLSKSKQRRGNGLKRKRYYIMFVKKRKSCKDQETSGGDDALHANEKVATLQVVVISSSNQFTPNFLEREILPFG